MCTKAAKRFFSVLSLLVLAGSSWASITLYAPPAGDAVYAWNSKYGPYGYTAGTTELGVGLYFGAPYGNDYTVSIIEIPIAALAGKTVSSAVLEVESLGFDTGYYYGSAGLAWVDTGARVLTGDVVADSLGQLMSSVSIEYPLFNSGVVAGTPGVKQFDVLNHLLSDLAAGRAYSTFVLCGSRDTYGAIYAAESGKGARIIAVPEPAAFILLAFGGLFLRKAH